MNFNVAMLKAMRDEGLSFEAAIRIFEAGELRRDPTATERKRRQRAKETAERDMSQRDVTRDTVPPDEELLTPSGIDLPNEASASLPARQPLSVARDSWNENAAQAGWPLIHSLSANRQKLLSARLREHGLEGWQAAIAKARASPYLSGSDPPSWFTFPWLIKSENFLKTIEGNYDRQHEANRGNNGRMGGPRPDPTLELLRAARAAQRPSDRDHDQTWLALPAR